MIDTGCSRFLVGHQTLTQRWGFCTQRVQLAKTMTFRFGNDETLETRTLVLLFVGIAGVNGVYACECGTWRSAALAVDFFLRDLDCHIDLGLGHLFFEKSGVRTVVTSKQSPHLFLPLTSFGPQEHKIPAELQPRIISDECAVYCAICDSSRQNKYIRRWPQHLTIEHLKLTAPKLNSCMERMDRRKTL